MSSYYYIDDVCVSTDSIFCNSYNYSCTVTSNYFPKSEQPKIYPQPFTNILNISFNNIGERRITVFDVLGNIITQVKTYQKEYVLSTESLSSGIYILKLSDNNTSTESNHIIFKPN